MSNEVMIPDVSNLPAYLKAVVAANPSLLQTNMDAAAGIGLGAVPRIVAKQGMFLTKVDGVTEPIQINVPGMGLINAPKISAVILKGKPTLDRAYFATAFSGEEGVSPDCSSEDGIRPKADSPNKQCEACAGCPQNMWGSATKQDGTPGKGKACAEKKRLAVYANNNVFRFDVPPASLGDFAAYSNQLSGHGLPLSAVVTAISFDPATPTKLVFGFQAILPEEAYTKIEPLVGGEKVRAIMENFTAAAPAQQQIEQKPADDSAAKAAAAAKEEADKKAAADKAAAEKKAAAKKAADEKKAAADKAAAEKAAAGSADLGLGIDLDMGGETSATAETAGTPTGEPSDEDLAALFSGL